MKHTQVAAWLMTLLICSTVSGQSQGTARGVVVDKMVATVNGELITYSDLLWQLALQPETPLDNPSSQDLQRAFDLMVRQRLIAQAATRLPALAPKDEEVEAALTELIHHFASEAQFMERIRKVGLTAEQLRDIVRNRVATEKYLDFRFRSFVVVTPKEIEEYYRDVYVPRFRRRSPGSIVPKLEEVRAEIERTLAENKIASDMTAFIDQARDRAEIVILNPL